MLILDKQRAVERIVALSDARARVAESGTPPKGARQRVATYQPRRVPQGAGEAVRGVVAAVRRRTRRAPFPA
jgi:hypothetical protein